MKKYINSVKYGVIIMLVALLFSFGTNDAARASGELLSVSVDFDTPYLYEYNGDYYFSGNSENNSMTVKYVIKNSSSETIKLSAVKIVETLGGSEDSSYGKTIYDDKITLAPDGELELKGNLFSFDDSEDFVFQYDVYVAYTYEDEFGIELPYTDDDFRSILSDDDNGIIYITREKINIDIEYDYFQSNDSIYAGDSVMICANLISNSNVPVKNVKLYDSAYGLIGEVAVIQPNEEITLNVDVTVRASTQSYPYLMYSSFDNMHVDEQIDFESSTIDIVVSKHSYNLGFEIQCENIYISKNQMVEVKFVVTNLGSGVVEDISILDGDGNVVFTVLSLESKDICEEKVILKFSPNNTYVYTCISPVTTQITAEVSFLSLPGLNLSYSFDKDIAQYKYFDTVTVTYTVENKGSVDAKDLVISDCGQIYSLGVLGNGEKRTFAMTFTITEEESVFKPVLTGKYADGSEIKEEGLETTVYVELPASYADIEFSIDSLPDIIYSGDVITVEYTLKNNGTGPLTSYSILIAEKNMIIASEGVLKPGETKSFSIEVLIEQSQSLTFKISGKHGENGDIYEKNSIVKINAALPEVTPTPPTPSQTIEVTPTTVPTATPPATGNDNGFQMMLVLIFAIGIVSVIMIIVTLVVVLKKVVGRK